MYELIDARTHGHADIERPLIIAERWGNTYRSVMKFRVCDEEYAKEILDRMNALVYGDGVPA